MDNASTHSFSEKGGISVQTTHIFPVIKKWLYSEKDIFLREIVSNAADAITKMKRLCSLGEAEVTDDKYSITVRLDKVAKTLTVEDNGIGMTADEVRKYICQIALSGALDFIDKYEGKSDTEGGGGIIGHFGLGFYSSFMVADKVELITRSYSGESAVHWVSSADGEYEITPTEREERGTTVIMHITDDEAEYLDSAKLRSMLNKYCSFMPYEIFFEDGSEETEGEPSPVNTTSPLWLKRAAECTEEDYREFYHKVFSDFNDPLFSIHINADYPLNFKGILYFPKLRGDYDTLEGQVKLYYNQVFVADNVKEIIPEYLVMLKGVIDCPELPLNVSRSYLQTNTYVSKVSAHIVKKIADKINSLARGEREKYNEIWGDIRAFIEYASIRDRKFFDRVKGSVLLKLTDGSCVTVDEYAERGEDTKEINDCTVYYTNDPAQQSQYISLYTSRGIKVAVLDQFIDTQFIAQAETVYEKIKFVRVDADVSALTAKENAVEDAKVTELFRAVSGNDKLEVKFEVLADSDTPALLTLSEEARRVDDFMKAYSMMTKTAAGASVAEQTLILNTSSPVYKHLTDVSASDDEKAKFIASYIYKLSLMSHRRLSAEELSAFLSDSYKLLNGF